MPKGENLHPTASATSRGRTLDPEAVRRSEKWKKDRDEADKSSEEEKAE